MKITGLDKVLKSLEFDESKLTNAIEQAGKLILDSAKANVHVDSGELKSSLNMQVTKTKDSIVANIGSNLFYAPFEEFGTGDNVFIVQNDSGYIFTTNDKQYASQFKRSGRGRKYAHPYLFPALFNNKSKVLELIKKATF